MHERIHSLKDKSLDALTLARQFIESKLRYEGEELIWVEPPAGPPYLGAYGASCAALALHAAGASPNNILVRRLVEWLCRNQTSSGAWTSRSAQPLGLTTACAFSLLAFGRCGTVLQKEEEVVAKAIRWCIDNFRDPGWPLHEGGEELSLTATALVANALHVLDDHLTPAARMLVRTSLDWIQAKQSEDGYWPCQKEGDGPSIGRTALLLRSLTACGFSASSQPIMRGALWLKGQDCRQHDTSEMFPIFSLRREILISYVHFTPAIALQALLLAGADVLSVEALDLAELIINNQRPEGAWVTPILPRQTPTWMSMDACLALSLFSQRVSVLQPYIEVNNKLLNTQAQVDELRLEIGNIQSRLDGMGNRLGAAERITNLLGRPLKLANHVRQNKWFLAVGLTLIAYTVVRPYGVSHRYWSEISAVILSGIFAVLGMLESRRRRID